VTFDFRNPDYREVFAQRADRLAWLRDDPTGERPIIGGVDWDALKTRCLDLLDA